jgi:GNAT superfamily N-acetyltransferase
MSIIIRKGLSTDIENTLHLVKELAAYENAPKEVEVTVEEMTNWGFGTDQIFDFYVAENNNTIVGIAIYYYKYSTWKGKCLFLEDIIVTESQRGKGIGKLLFNKVIEVAKETTVRRMEWQVLDWNKPAIDFYKKYDSTLDGEWINCKLTNHDLEKF